MQAVPFPSTKPTPGAMRVVFVREKSLLGRLLCWWNRSAWSHVFVGENGSPHVYSASLMKRVHDRRIDSVRRQYEVVSEMVIDVPDTSAALDYLFNALGMPGEWFAPSDLVFFALSAGGKTLVPVSGDRELGGLDGLREALVLSGAVFDASVYGPSAFPSFRQWMAEA